MEVAFCSKCENMMYLFHTEDTKELYYCCKSCGNKEKIEQNKHLIYKDDQEPLDKGEIINSNSYITHDITLPSISGNSNIKCNNELCDAEETDIKYIKYDELNMKYIYICNHCGYKWKNNL